MAGEKSLEELLVESAYLGYFMGKRTMIVNAPPEVALGALTKLCGTRGTALGWQKFGEAYRYLYVSKDPTLDAGVIARRIGGGDGNKEVSEFTAGKLLVVG